MKLDHLLLLLAITGASALVATTLRRHESPAVGAVLIAVTSGTCAALAGLITPLTFGLAITQPAVQGVIGGCVAAGFISGLVTARHRAIPLLAAVAGPASFALTLQAIAQLYPAIQRG